MLGLLPSSPLKSKLTRVGGLPVWEMQSWALDLGLAGLQPIPLNGTCVPQLCSDPESCWLLWVLSLLQPCWLPGHPRRVGISLWGTAEAGGTPGRPTPQLPGPGPRFPGSSLRVLPPGSTSHHGMCHFLSPLVTEWSRLARGRPVPSTTPLAPGPRSSLSLPPQR